MRGGRPEICLDAGLGSAPFQEGLALPRAGNVAAAVVKPPLGRPPELDAVSSLGPRLDETFLDQFPERPCCGVSVAIKAAGKTTYGKNDLAVVSAVVAGSDFDQGRSRQCRERKISRTVEDIAK